MQMQAKFRLHLSNIFVDKRLIVKEWKTVTLSQALFPHILIIKFKRKLFKNILERQMSSTLSVVHVTLPKE